MTDVECVLALEERRRQALLAVDLVTLQGLLAEDLVYVHSTGVRDCKDSYLAKISGGRLKYLELDFSDLQVQTLTQVAVLSGRMQALVSKNGQSQHLTTLFMTIWACASDGVWRLHAHQGTALS